MQNQNFGNFNLGGNDLNSTGQFGAGFNLNSQFPQAAQFDAKALTGPQAGEVSIDNHKLLSSSINAVTTQLLGQLGLDSKGNLVSESGNTGNLQIPGIQTTNLTPANLGGNFGGISGATGAVSGTTGGQNFGLGDFGANLNIGNDLNAGNLNLGGVQGLNQIQTSGLPTSAPTNFGNFNTQQTTTTTTNFTTQPTAGLPLPSTGAIDFGTIQNQTSPATNFPVSSGTTTGGIDFGSFPSQITTTNTTTTNFATQGLPTSGVPTSGFPTDLGSISTQPVNNFPTQGFQTDLGSNQNQTTTTTTTTNFQNQTLPTTGLGQSQPVDLNLFNNSAATTTTNLPTQSIPTDFGANLNQATTTTNFLPQGQTTTGIPTDFSSFPAQTQTTTTTTNFQTNFPTTAPQTTTNFDFGAISNVPAQGTTTTTNTSNLGTFDINQFISNNSQANTNGISLQGIVTLPPTTTQQTTTTTTAGLLPSNINLGGISSLPTATTAIPASNIPTTGINFGAVSTLPQAATSALPIASTPTAAPAVTTILPPEISSVPQPTQIQAAPISTGLPLGGVTGIQDLSSVQNVQPITLATSPSAPLISTAPTLPGLDYTQTAVTQPLAMPQTFPVPMPAPIAPSVPLGIAQAQMGPISPMPIGPIVPNMTSTFTAPMPLAAPLIPAPQPIIMPSVMPTLPMPAMMPMQQPIPMPSRMSMVGPQPMPPVPMRPSMMMRQRMIRPSMMRRPVPQSIVRRQGQPSVVRRPGMGMMRQSGLGNRGPMPMRPSGMMRPSILNPQRQIVPPQPTLRQSNTSIKPYKKFVNTRPNAIPMDQYGFVQARQSGAINPRNSLNGLRPSALRRQSIGRNPALGAPYNGGSSLYRSNSSQQFRPSALNRVGSVNRQTTKPYRNNVPTRY